MPVTLALLRGTQKGHELGCAVLHSKALSLKNKEDTMVNLSSGFYYNKKVNISETDVPELCEMASEHIAAAWSVQRS